MIEDSDKLNDGKPGLTSGKSFTFFANRFILENLGILLSFCISGVLLWLTIKSSGLVLQKLALSGTQLAYFAAAVFSFVLATWVQSVRAKLFWVSDRRRFKDIHAYKSLVVGNFYICLLPGNLGEGMRAWHFSKKNKVPFSRSLAAVLAEKWIDAQAFVLLALILFSMKAFYRHYISYAIAGTAIVVMVLSVIYTLMRRYRHLEKALWGVVLMLKKPGRFLYRLYWHTICHLSNVRKQGHIGGYVLLCLIIISLNLLQFYLLLKCAGITGDECSFYTAFLAATSMMIIAFVPSAPSNVGVLHYGIYSVLLMAAAQYNYKPGSMDLQNYALYAVYLHLSLVMPEIVIGAVVLVLERKIMFQR